MKDRRLLVGYVIHEIVDDLSARLSLSLTSLKSCTDPSDVAIIVLCRSSVAALLPQMGLTVCAVPQDGETTLEESAIDHPVVKDSGFPALLLLEPTTLVLKDVARDAFEMREFHTSVAVNLLTAVVPRSYDSVDRSSLPLIVTPMRDYRRRSGGRWVCGYTYGLSEGGYVGSKAYPGLCTTPGLLGMTDAVLKFQDLARSIPVIRLTKLGTPKIRYYAVLLAGRPERVAIVDAMRDALPAGSLTVVNAVDGARELDGEALASLSRSGFLTPPYVDEYVHERPIMVNTVASFMSHVRALNRLVEDMESDPDAVGVILEDDVRFLGPPGSFHDVISRIACSAWNESNGPHVIQGYVLPVQRMFVSPLVAWNSGRTHADDPLVLPSPESNWGMQCYMMKLEGARRLLEGFKTMKGAADEQISRIPGLDLRCLVGPIILDEDGASAPSVSQTKPRYVRDEIVEIVTR